MSLLSRRLAKLEPRAVVNVTGRDARKELTQRIEALAARVGQVTEASVDEAREQVTSFLRGAFPTGPLQRTSRTNQC